MYDHRVQYGLDNFIMDEYFQPMAASYHLLESKDSGKSDLLVEVKHTNLCIHDFDSHKKCNFLKTDKVHGMQKSVDHAIFQNTGTSWTLHLIEMKSSVGNITWINMKQKVRTSYLTACAIAVFLGIQLENVYVYTTYEMEKFNNMSDTTNPKIYMPKLGETAIDYKKEEWDKNQIRVCIDTDLAFPHRKIKMNRGGDGEVLEGRIAI